MQSKKKQIEESEDRRVGQEETKNEKETQNYECQRTDTLNIHSNSSKANAG